MSVSDEIEIYGTKSLDSVENYIIDASWKLPCSIFVRTKALLIYQQFRAFVKDQDVKYYDSDLLAAACLDSSIRVIGDDIDFDAVILVFINMKEKEKCNSLLSERFKIFKKSVASINILIIRVLAFSLSSSTALDFLPYFMEQLQDVLSVLNFWEVFSTTCLHFACDFYLTKNCLDFKAEEIAMAAIKASATYCGIKVDKDECIIKRYLQAYHNCREERLNMITNYMLENCIKLDGETCTERIVLDREKSATVKQDI